MRTWPTLILLLKDPDERVRDAARGALARIYPVIPPATRAALKDKNLKVRSEAMTSNYLQPRPLWDVDADARDGARAGGTRDPRGRGRPRRDRDAAERGRRAGPLARGPWNRTTAMKARPIPVACGAIPSASEGPTPSENPMRFG